MALSKARRPLPPLNEDKLRELGLRYVGRYATTRAKLRSYLSRKVRERGWNGAREPDLASLADRFAELGYIDDAAYAMSKSRSLSGRGYGRRRLAEKLKIAGVADDDSREALETAEGEAVAAALRFAERRRIGPYASVAADRAQREKWIAAMVRAGHGYRLARGIAALAPGGRINLHQLSELAGVIEM